MKEICFVKFTMFGRKENHLLVSNYKIQKETAKRVYFYPFLDEDTTEDEVTYISKDSLNNLVIEHRGEHSIVAYNWCYKEDVNNIKEELKNGLREYLMTLLNSISTYNEKEKNKYR